MCSRAKGSEGGGRGEAAADTEGDNFAFGAFRTASLLQRRTEDIRPARSSLYTRARRQALRARPSRFPYFAEKNVCERARDATTLLLLLKPASCFSLARRGGSDGDGNARLYTCAILSRDFPRRLAAGGARVCIYVYIRAKSEGKCASAGEREKKVAKSISEESLGALWCAVGWGRKSAFPRREEGRERCVCVCTRWRGESIIIGRAFFSVKFGYMGARSGEREKG